MTIDRGLTHIALPVADIDRRQTMRELRSIEFYAAYARMQTIHRRVDAATGVTVVWLSDLTRPFAIVLGHEKISHSALLLRKNGIR